jgi:hypothetical protein
MPHAQIVNYALNTSGDQFSAIFKLTRAMMAAGWKYRGSGNGQSSGSPAWNTQNTGASAQVGTVTGSIATITNLTNMSPGNEGQWITMSGSAHAGNNGTFLIVLWVSATSVQIYNPSAVASDTGPLTWNLVRDSSLDLWQVDGHVNLTSVPGGGTSSGAVVIATQTGTGQATITGVSGFSQNASPGRVVTITGSLVGNNGSWRISDTTTLGTSVDVYAPQLVAESGNASLAVTEQYGGNVASITTFTSAGSGQNTLINVIGLSGLTAADVGRRIKFLNPANPANLGSFLIVSVVSSSSCVIYHPFAVQNDYGVGGTSGSPTLQWVEWDPIQSTYPAYLGSGAWILMQGPTIMKIPIGTSVPTGFFVRGENVSQANTGAQGELLGVITDASGGTGFLVIAPRVIGTGANAGPATDANMTYGWSTTTDTITGSVSGATVAPSVAATPIAYIRELIFWRASSTNGHTFYQCIDQNPSGTEAPITATTGRFSTMAATLSQISATVPPASSATTSPTTNGAPTVNQGAGSYIGMFVPMGTAATGNVNSGDPNWCCNGPSVPGRAHLLCANAVEGFYAFTGSIAVGVSADGTWHYLQSCNSVGYQVYSFLRVDNQEDGDLDPYVFMVEANGAQSGTPTRYSMSGGAGSSTDNGNFNNLSFGSNSFHAWAGFRRRGLPNENYSWFSTALLYDLPNTYLVNINGSNPDQVATAVTTTYVREPVWVHVGANTGQNSGVRMRKGTPRWLFTSQGGSVNATFDNKSWIILSSSPFQMVAGPWDGATTPSF